MSLSDFPVNRTHNIMEWYPCTCSFSLIVSWAVKRAVTQNTCYTCDIKHLMTDPRGNSGFCFPKTLNVPLRFASGNIEVEGKQTSLLTMGPVINCFVIPLNSKIEKKTAKKSSFAWRQLAHKLEAVSRSMTWSRVSWKFRLLFPKGVSEFWTS